ncbi:HDOD domain-containing protein [Pseudomonas sp. GV071]|jgi:HD-like signal output (HDOD) protein|uniref:HDOD domain-containing protein n=1 Tax=Pseudomonas sp. GV071 TaxID=2135754 RepID=UPI000D3D0E15|nr:HDOD domain-containing protein [Pseudomonas sp. GV071]PTQ68729.1 HDOD domain-containing protein [Pseudomonas sp. GV071]
MPTLPPLPSSLKTWLKHLDSVRLPILATTHERVRRSLVSSSTSLREVAERIEASPSLALLVLREANRSNNSLSEPAESLEIAISRLGLARTEDLLNMLPVLAEDKIPKPLRQIQLISLHASQQASGLFANRLARLWQEIHWSSLLFLAPLWPLAAAHPELIEEWEHRVLALGEPTQKVERELFGVSLPTLCLALAEHWRLPAWIIQAYRLLATERRLLAKALHIARNNEEPLHQQQLLDADPALSRWLTQPGNTIVFANALALSSHAGWQSAHSLRWQRITALYLQVSLAELQQLTHQQAVNSARQYSASDLWHPAQALLWPWDVRRLQAAPPPPVAKDTSPAWQQHCRELLREPSAFANLLQLTTCIRDALDACGMSRALVLLADKTHSRLVTQQTVGLPKEAQALTLDPANSQVLKRLLAQPGQLRLSPENIAQFSALMPGTLKALFPGEHMLIRSLANNGKVVMLLVVDQQGTPLSDPCVQAFGKISQCIERALASFAKRGR